MIEYLNVLNNNYKEDITLNQWINGHIAAKNMHALVWWAVRRRFHLGQ